MANDTTLHANLDAALQAASLSQTGTGTATRASHDWLRLDAIPAIAACPLYQVRSVYSTVLHRDSNNQLDELALELVQAFRIDGSNPESTVRVAMRLISRTLSRSSWWTGASSQIKQVAEEPTFNVERIGRALVLTTTLRLTLVP